MLAAREARNTERAAAMHAIAIGHRDPAVYGVYLLVQQYGMVRVVEAVRLLVSFYGLDR